MDTDLLTIEKHSMIALIRRIHAEKIHVEKLDAESMWETFILNLNNFNVKHKQILCKSK